MEFEQLNVKRCTFRDKVNLIRSAQQHLFVKVVLLKHKA
ncbi:Uncharacterised protein [Vibrio cholerae]|nr:Uncharacterised protein [Vibrio cholerae]CSI31526.1 Uncharacterised protein [Vibrio cholerae]CSI63305.1 Uncharacterised protein [Vibrio cholerae]